MKPIKLSKLLLTMLVVLPATMFFAGCSSDDDPVVLDPVDPVDPIDPTDPTPAPPVGTINGIWEGTMSFTTTAKDINYDTLLLFRKDAIEERGDSAGIAFGDGPLSKDALTEYPHFTFAGGFAFFTETVISTDPDSGLPVITCEVPDPANPENDSGVWAVGRFGEQGTFLQEFAYDTGTAAGPDQRGAGCLYFATDAVTGESKLTGEVQFEEAGKLLVDLAYSADNARTVTTAALGTVGNDGSVDEEYHLWSPDNGGTSMSYTSSGASIQVVENSDVSSACGGTVSVTQFGALNLFTVATLDPHVTGCDIITEIIKVELPYEGLAAMVDMNGDDIPEYVQLMKSTGGGAGLTAHMLQNWFTTDIAGGEF